jgi:hypothetical protein
MVIEHVIDGDQRDTVPDRKLCALRQPGTVIAAIEHGGSQPHASGSGITQAGEKTSGLRASVCVIPVCDHPKPRH